MLALLLVAAALRATHSPATPTVGDRVAIHFEIAGDEAATLDPSPDYEIVSRSRDGAVVRAFRPQPVTLSGTVAGPHGSVAFRHLVLPMRSVLRKGDDGKPAPLTPPVAVAAPATGWIALGVAAILAAVSWVVLYRMAGPVDNPAAAAPPAPDEELRAAIAAIRRAPSLRWAALADATRRYLARVAPQFLGSDLTTRELLGRLASVSTSPEWQTLVRRIVVEGDLDKFSPWGASAEIEAILDETLGLLPQPFRLPAQEVAA
jgi:hypothetical protein